jgi:hypothetical protein
MPSSLTTVHPFRFTRSIWSANCRKELRVDREGNLATRRDISGVPFDFPGECITSKARDIISV